MMKTLFYTLIGVGLCIGAFFKLLHYPGAAILLNSSLVGAILALLQFAYTLRHSIFALLPVLWAISITGGLFELNHWPFPDLIYQGSSMLIAILFPLLFIRRAQQVRGEAPSFAVWLFIIGLLMAFNALFNNLIIYFNEDAFLINFQVDLIIGLILLIAPLIIIAITLGLSNLQPQARMDFRVLKLAMVFLAGSLLANAHQIYTNLSEGVLADFETVNKGIQRDLEKEKGFKERLYQEIKNASAEMSEKHRQQLSNMQDQAQRVRTYIDELRDTLIQASGGKDQDGNLKNPHAMSVASEHFIQKGKGDTLRKMLKSFRSTQVKIKQNWDSGQVNNDVLLQVPSSPPGAAKNTWARERFHQVPVNAALTILSTIKNDVTKAESELLSALPGRKVDANDDTSLQKSPD